MPKPKKYSILQAARKLGIGWNTLKRMVERGEVKVIESISGKRVFIPEIELKRLLEKNKKMLRFNVYNMPRRRYLSTNYTSIRLDKETLELLKKQRTSKGEPLGHVIKKLLQKHQIQGY
jgi:hypothetical protein